MRTRLSLPLVAALLAAPVALAEKAPINIHLDPAVGFGLDASHLVSGATLKVDTTLIEALGPVAPQLEAFGYGALNNSYLVDGSAFGFGIGARLRLFNDEKGYLFNPGTSRSGNIWGNWWVDAHFTINTPGLGFDAATGAELSLIDGLSVGPFAKYSMMGPHSLLTFGLSVTIGAPQTAPGESDYDGDGVLGAADKCPDEAGPASHDGCPVPDSDGDGIADDVDKCPSQPEDKDGIQDDDGCPETDADGDGVLDEADKCPLVKGPAANAGCPDADQDGDGVVDRLDKCPTEKGPAENAGCPDTDQDGDGVADRLDKCPTEKGPKDNAGCPWPDQDGDGVPDRFDNCPTEKGPAENAGCPAKQKQLVSITAEKIEIKDKVYFDTGKASIQRRSFKLLDQIAAVLTSHPEIKLVQVEGHTDSTGKAEVNRKLSNDRATSVRDYLVKKGVETARLRPMGFGPDRPVDSNETAAGRENNRRVEFNIVDQ